MIKSELKYKNWMVTILSNKDGSLPLPKPEDVVKVFKEESEKWVFQEETHENAEIEKTHYQCAIVTKIRQRKQTVLKNLSDALSHPIERIRVDKMAGSWEQAQLYCSKNDSRVSDTYASTNLNIVYDYSDIDFLHDEDKRFPWQKDLLAEVYEKAPNSIKTPDDRTIYWVTDIAGNSGKSKLVKFCCAYNDLSVKISFATANQLRGALTGLGPRKLYCVDFPRTLGDDDSMNDIMSVLEDLKNGYLVSSFYGIYAELKMLPPTIVVFSNNRPPIEKISKDRWKCYTIVQKELRYAVDNEDYMTLGYSMSNEGVKYAD